jgi:folate-binding protein YgfZ
MATVSLTEQYTALRASAGVADLSAEEVFELTGDGRVDFLNNYNSQDIKTLPEYGAARGTFQTQKGKLVGDAWILKLPEKILLLFAPGFGAKVHRHLEIYLNFADADFQDLSGHWGHLALLGPKAAALLESTAGVFSAREKNAVHRLTFQEKPLLAFYTERFGVEGWELLSAREIFAPLKAAFLNSGALSAGDEVLELLRVEAGLPKMGVDMGEDNLVAEVGLDKDAVSFNKGCYLGQETTARVQSQGRVNKKLIRLKLKKAFHGAPPLEVFQGENKIGQVTSIVDSIQWQVPLALGIVQIKAVENNQPMTIQTPEGTIEVELIRIES